MDRIAEFCQRNRIRRLALFGSVLRDDFTPESDVDVLVEFEPGARVGFAFVTVQDELSNILGRRARHEHLQGDRRKPELAAQGGDTRFKGGI